VCAVYAQARKDSIVRQEYYLESVT